MTENQTKTELLAAMGALSEAIPSMRFGQLLAAVGELCADLHGRGLWDASDGELLEAVWQFHHNFEAATAPRPANSIAAPDLGRHTGFASPQDLAGGAGR